MGFKCNFIITPTRGYHINKHYSKSISYEENFKCLVKLKLFLIILVLIIRSVNESYGSIVPTKKIITDNILIKNYDLQERKHLYIRRR